MSNPLYLEGTPWWVSRILTADATLVTPESVAVGVMKSGTGVRSVQGGRLILCGFHYDFVAANGNGFDLQWNDGTARIIISPRATTAITRVEGGATGMWVMGPKGIPSGPTNAGFLELNCTATPPTSGQILAWGIHLADDSAFLQGKGNYGTGSPITF